VLAQAAPAAPDTSPDFRKLFPDAASIDSRLRDEGYGEYEKEALFDYINGGAEVYLGLGFVRVGAREYVADLEEEIWFTLDVYDMGEPRAALAIFSAEAYGEPESVEVGASGYLGGGALAFWSRRYYVKIRADDEGEEIDGILRKIGEAVSARIGDPGSPIPELALFPEADRVRGSERYVARDFLGLKGVSGFSCRYERNGERWEFHLVRASSPEEASEIGEALEKKFGEDRNPLAVAGSTVGYARRLSEGEASDAASAEGGDWVARRVGEFFGRLLAPALRGEPEKGSGGPGEGR
jgi:hypothetical protein